jgi:hypothetical protein
VDALLVALYILVASVNAAGMYALWLWLKLHLTPRAVVQPVDRFAREPFPLRDADAEAMMSGRFAQITLPARRGGKEWAAALRGAAALPIPLGGLSWTGRSDYGLLAQQRSLTPAEQIAYQRERMRAEAQRDLLEQHLRAARDAHTLRAPASPLPPLFPSGLTATHAGLSTEKSMSGNSFYILKTARTPVNREGRFVVVDGDDNMSIGPANAAMGINVVKRFAKIGDILVTLDHGYGLPESTIRGLRICKVTEVMTEPMRAVEEVTLSAAKTAKLVVRLAKPGSYQLYRQGDRERYGELATAQVFNGLADLQRRAPQTYTNPEREVLALVEQPGRSTFTEVEIG